MLTIPSTHINSLHPLLKDLAKHGLTFQARVVGGRVICSFHLSPLKSR
jgi:hypothetical protein